jgi:hypothetical protein
MTYLNRSTFQSFSFIQKTCTMLENSIFLKHLLVRQLFRRNRHGEIILVQLQSQPSYSPLTLCPSSELIRVAQSHSRHGMPEVDSCEAVPSTQISRTTQSRYTLLQAPIANMIFQSRHVRPAVMLPKISSGG